MTHSALDNPPYTLQTYALNLKASGEGKKGKMPKCAHNHRIMEPR